MDYGQKAYEFLEKLSFPRVSGSEAEKKAAEMICEEIRTIGFAPVTETFEVTRDVPCEAELKLTAPEEVSYEVRGAFNAAPTGPEGLDADFYYPGLLDEFTFPKCRDKIVLYTNGLAEKDYKKLKENGALGYILTNGTMRDTPENADLDTGRFRDVYLPYGKMPALTMRVTDAMDLLRRKPEKVHIRLQMESVTKESRNVIVEVPGTEKPEEVIVCGAHFDSTEFSCGAWDNGAGVTHMLALLQHLKENPPKRTVHVIFFGSEEIGLKGSRAYLDAHEEEAGKILYMINSDVGGSILGGEMIVSTAVSDLEGYVHGLMCECGYSARLFSGTMSSDSNVFADFGIPALSMGQIPAEGAGFMHTRYDNFARISADVLDREIRFLIHIADRFANMAVFPVPRVIPKDLREKLINYFGKDISRTAKQTEFPEEPEPRKPMF